MDDALKRVGLVFLLTGALALAAGCKEEGPAEEAGEELDKAAEQLEEGAEEAGKEINKALEGVGD